MAKNWIPLRQVEGTASRQAHADLPEGTYEREISKEGFFGPSAHFHHRHQADRLGRVRGPPPAARLRPQQARDGASRLPGAPSW